MPHTISESFYPMLEAKQAATQPGVDMAITEVNGLVTGQPEQVREPIYAGTDVMGRDGSKRMRPVIFETGYRLYGGQDPTTIALGAGAVELLHTVLVMKDDYQDGSKIRRGDDTAHVAAGKYYEEQGISHDPKKLGISTVDNAAFIMHLRANRILRRLAVPPEYKELAADIIDDCLEQTGIGQLRDLTSNPAKPPTPDEVLETYWLKTGRYSVYMPGAVGMVLGGASARQVKPFRRYAEPVGKAFQLHDDLLDIIGDPKKTGKPQGGDIAEGKYTWPMVTALERAGTNSRAILLRSLGNRALSGDEFNNCSRILEQTGAIADAQALVEKLTDQAVNALDAAPFYLPAEQVAFLKALAVHGATREK